MSAARPFPAPAEQDHGLRRRRRIHRQTPDDILRLLQPVGAFSGRDAAGDERAVQPRCRGPADARRQRLRVRHVTRQNLRFCPFRPELLRQRPQRRLPPAGQIQPRRPAQGELTRQLLPEPARRAEDQNPFVPIKICCSHSALLPSL